MRGMDLNSVPVRESRSETPGWSRNSPFLFGRPLGGLITWWVVAREEVPAWLPGKHSTAGLRGTVGVPRQANKAELPTGSARPGRED